MLSVTHKVRIIAVLTILAALCVYPVRAATPYTVDDLGTLGGGYSWPYFINEAGQVVGVSDGHAFVWGNGMMTDLGTLGGGYSYPYVANEVGEVAGVSQTASGEEHAFLWKGGALIDLGTLGGSSSSPAGINEAGEIIGYAAIVGNAEYHPFLWKEGVMTDLGTFGGAFSFPYDINEAGQVVGYSGTASGEEHAFFWENGVMTDLGTGATTSSRATGINEAGQVIGYFGADGSPEQQAFAWKDGVMTILGSLGGGDSVPIAMNEAGQVVGAARTANGWQHAYLWENGVMTDLGTLGGNRSYPTAINESGQVVGTATTAADQEHAFLWKGGVMTDLGTLGGTTSYPSAINEAGQVMGYVKAVPDTGDRHAFVWACGTMTDLGTFGGTYSEPTAINEAGQVVGYAATDDNATVHAFLALPPANQAPTANANGPYLVAVGQQVTLDSAGSCDPSGHSLTSTWSAGGGSVTGNVYTAGAVPGIYTVQLIVNNGQADSLPATTFVVVYNPNGGYVTGGGWISSPAGALTTYPTAAGKAEFGFEAMYQKGATVPNGTTEFQFRAGQFRFRSTSYQWLVVAGAKAQFKGQGSVDGSDHHYGFMLTIIDGQVNGGGGVDKFRLKAWDIDNGGAVVYDNQMGSADTDNPTTMLGGGSIVIHK